MRLGLLQDFLNKHEFSAKEDKTGFLDIIGKESNENIISKLYAHFINCDDNDVRSAFVESLVEIIRKKRKDLDFNILMPTAKTEVKARNNKRIDLLLMDKDEHSFIIIENKINHWLQNNLWDYYYFDKKGKKYPNHKIGVLLTLGPYKINDSKLTDKFINITHGEWIGETRKRLIKGKSLSKTDIYLNDFLNNMEKLIKKKNLDEQATFYFQNAKKIDEAIATKKSAYDFLESELNLIASNLNLQLDGFEMKWRNIWDKENNLDVYFTIDLEDLVKGGKMSYRLILEISGKPRQESNEFLNKVKKLSCFKKLTIEGCESSANYIHFAAKDYKISLKELNSFHLHVLWNLKKDFEKITILALQHFYVNKPYAKNWDERFKRLELQELNLK